MKHFPFLLFLFGVILTSCSSSKKITESESPIITPPANFDASAYKNPKDYGLDPKVKAEINKQPNSDYSEETDFKKAVIVGGMKKLQQNADYPRNALKYSIEGRVYTKIYIDEKGKLTNIEILKSPDESLSQSAIQALIKTNFEPAILKGKSVKSILLVSVLYQLYSQKIRIQT